MFIAFSAGQQPDCREHRIKLTFLEVNRPLKGKRHPVNLAQCTGHYFPGFFRVWFCGLVPPLTGAVCVRITRVMNWMTAFTGGNL